MHRSISLDIGARGASQLVGPRTQVPYDTAWRNTLECATIEVFEMMAGVRLTSVATPGGEPVGEQTAMVGMAGALCGMATIRCSSATAAKLAARMLGDDATSNPSMVADALGELCSMVAGNFKAKVQSLADHCVRSVPTVISEKTTRCRHPNRVWDASLRSRTMATRFGLLWSSTSNCGDRQAQFAPRAVPNREPTGPPDRRLKHSANEEKHRLYAFAVRASLMDGCKSDPAARARSLVNRGSPSISVTSLAP